MANLQLNRVVRHLRGVCDPRALTEAADAQLLERFLTHHEEAAFEALVRRHGPMVLGVARRVLRRVQDAEDVFQATFLLLARKAGSIRRREAVGSWLHGVAHRLALRLKAQGATRQAHERRAADMRTSGTDGGEEAGQDVQATLDTALEELPEKYRSALVLCYLEGKTHQEAAELLGCPLATVRTHVARGRKLLRNCLIRHGLTLSPVALATLLITSAAPAAAPAVLVRATLKAALPFAAGATAAGLCSPQVAGLVEGGLQTMVLGKVKIATAVLLAVTVFAGVAVTYSQEQGSAKQQAAEAKPPATDAAAQAAGEGEVTTVEGRVLRPDGQPVAGAKLYLHYYSRAELTYPVQATSGVDGRFRFTFKLAKLEPAPADDPWFQVLAVADGYGPDWTSLGKPGKKVERTLRLVKDLPIQGRILDLNGKPVAGATLRVEELSAYADLDAFLETVRNREWPRVNSKTWGGPLPGQPKVLTTGRDGRFRLEGAGRDRVVQFQLEGPGIAYGPVRALTRELKAAVEPRRPQTPFSGPNILKVYGANFDYASEPGRLIRGLVRDKKNRKPVAGVEISGVGLTQRTRTDPEGRYELPGCPKTGKGYLVSAQPVGQPYFSAGVRFPDTLGLDPIQGDIDLVGGIPVHGRITHAVTGQPIAGALVHYNPLYPNPFVGRLLGPNGAGSSPCSWTKAGPDGSYTLVVLPGPGALGYLAYSKEPLMPALVTAKELRDLLGHDEDYNNEDVLKIQAGVNSFTVVGQKQFNHLVLINPKETAETLSQDATLQPAHKLVGKLVGPDGKPLQGVRAFHLAPGVWSETLETEGFTVQGFNPKRMRQLLFVHKEKNLGAVVEIRGEVKESLTVRLEPCGSVAGRLLDEDGQPAANTVVRAEPPAWLMESGPRVRTDRDGRFRIDGLIPGLQYQVRQGPGPFGQYLFAPLVLKPGENKELGEARAKMASE